jgi:hypothetical protein
VVAIGARAGVVGRGWRVVVMLPGYLDEQEEAEETRQKKHTRRNNKKSCQ